jgi:hypothetical protein
MIYTDPKTQQEFVIKVTAAFKKRVKLFVQKVYNLPTLPTNYILKKMFNLKSISKAMNWLTIFSITEDKVITDEMTPEELFTLEVEKACEKYGCVMGDIDFVGARSIKIHKTDSKGVLRLIGRIVLRFDGVCVGFGNNTRANLKPVNNIGHGFHQLIAVFEKN